MITYVDAKKVSSEVPGYCFIRAGFKKKGIIKRRKLLLFQLPIAKNYLAKRKVETINYCQQQLQIALDSGEFYEALWFQQLAQKQFEWLEHLQSMIKVGRLTAWKDYYQHMELWELEEMISHYEGLGEFVEDWD
ncbi:MULTISPECIES: hypothetical protein [unclassified Paenibacillus]|uniref:Uncharacterized protein n=1 Tax=Paenibacillus provencensis TaxID=441151 RepID=A0ABW3PYH6_9BACL|nr:MULTISPECIES: hypothetical protein [unclassified Paenibacillus]MCM3130131.1 hypothetical protein [Paenibacillus sp. MER 78]SDX70192.1 hypothetical protein SAMN05518848_11219 [Paenibacillus sp. PDC88]SFS87984.1 hypothetical protein SAMN04488601_10615 [Paenibacillus sp. 453mf]